MAGEGQQAGAGGTRRSAARRVRTVALALLAGVAVALVLVEVLFRFALSDSGASVAWCARLRDPGLYAAPWQDGYWKLQWGLTRDEQRPTPVHDPLLGWTGTRVEPGSYANVEERALAGRRPILLYGDSFAEGVGEPEARFTRILERSDLAGTYGLVNYGVGGYGVGQIFLMLRESIDRFAERDPVVIVGILVEGDLDRSVLRFRGWPKPRLVARDGGLEPEEPVVEGAEAYLAAHPVGFPSYAWRWLVHGGRLLPEGLRASLSGRDEARAGVQELNRAILQELRDELASRELEYFVVLFYGLGALKLRGELWGWEEPWLNATLDELGMPFVSCKRELRRYASEQGLRRNQLFVRSGPGKGHYNARGNEAAFEAFRRGLRGEFDSGPGRPNVPPAAARPDRSRGVEWIDPGDGGTPRLELRPDTEELPSLAWSLEGRYRSLRFELRRAGGECRGLSLVVRLDGVEVHRRPVRAGGAVDLGLAGAHDLELALDGEASDCEAVHLCDPLLR